MLICPLSPASRDFPVPISVPVPVPSICLGPAYGFTGFELPSCVAGGAGWAKGNPQAKAKRQQNHRRNTTEHQVPYPANVTLGHLQVPKLWETPVLSEFWWKQRITGSLSQLWAAPGLWFWHLDAWYPGHKSDRPPCFSTLPFFSFLLFLYSLEGIWDNPGFSAPPFQIWFGTQAKMFLLWLPGSGSWDKRWY